MRNRKRTRWTVTYSPHRSNEVERSVILAYDAPGARSFYEARGTVLEVRKGDYRLQAQRAAMQPTGAKVNHLAVRAQAKDLGLSLPVEIKVIGRKGGARARHTIIRGHAKHYISVKNYLTPEQMSRSLHHELEHARQYEQDAGCDWDAWEAMSKDGVTYRNKNIERQARAAEERHTTRSLAR